MSAVNCGTAPSAQVQLESSGEPTKEVDESGHDTQVVASGAANVLAWQAAHATAARCDDVPGWQGSHTPVVTFRKVPASHAVHPVAPPSEK